MISNDRYRIQFKMDSHTLLLIGPPRAGKSMLTCYLAKIKYLKKSSKNSSDEDDYNPTIGVDFTTHHIGGTRFNIWDHSGQEQSRRCLAFANLKFSTILLCYDITSRISFEQATQEIINDLVIYDQEAANVFLIGCKSDLESKREIAIEEGQSMATRNGMRFLETSALTGAGLEDFLSHLLEL